MDTSMGWLIRLQKSRRKSGAPWGVDIFKKLGIINTASVDSIALALHDL